jgi:hypothetical protein
MNRKGQEEIVGFVLIMVLISVIFLVFLGITLRNPDVSERKSETVYQFLESAMEQTTECVPSGRRINLDLDDLIGECYSSNSECDNGNKSCVVLNRTIKNILDSTWRYGEDLPLKGYSFESVYSLNNSAQAGTEERFLGILEGNCNGTIVGNSYWSPEFPGSITSTLKLCYR